MATERRSNRPVSVSGLVSRGVSALYQAFVALTLLFLVAPLVIVLILSVSESAYAQWPPTGFSLEWYADLPQVLSRFGVWEALSVSLGVAAVVAILSTVVGGLAAFGLVRYEFRYQASIEAFFLSPLIYPWIVVGIALLLAFSAVGIDTSFWTLVAGHTVAVLPYPIRMIASNLHNFNVSLEEAAANLGQTSSRRTSGSPSRWSSRGYSADWCSPLFSRSTSTSSRCSSRHTGQRRSPSNCSNCSTRSRPRSYRRSRRF
jgi:ABC-type spermidine/putrescine transport system, permease component II